MILYINEKGEIKDVNTNSHNDDSLIEVVVNDDENPFEGWSAAKICCYKVDVKDGRVMMMTPYVDSRLIEHIDQLGVSTEINAADINVNGEGIAETYEGMSVNTTDIESLMQAVTELYEMMEV